MTPIQTIIIEAHSGVRQALMQRLSKDPALAIVGVCDTPTQALAYLSQQPVDLIVLGLQHEYRRNLLQLTDVIRRLAAFQAAVVALTPYIDEIEREICLQAGARRYLLKHINSSDLIDHIKLAAAGS